MGATVNILKMQSLTDYYGRSNILLGEGLAALQDTQGTTPYKATYSIVYNGIGTAEENIVYFDFDSGQIEIGNTIFAYTPTDGKFGKYCLTSLYANISKTVEFSWGFVESAGANGRQIFVLNPTLKGFIQPQLFGQKFSKGIRINHDSANDAGNVYPMQIVPVVGCVGSIVFGVEYCGVEVI